MTCAEVQTALSLYLYGELDFADEEALEVHLGECAFCQLALNREKEWHAAVNRQQQDITPEWLAACRTDLHQRMVNELTAVTRARHVVAEWWKSFFDFRLTERSYRLAAISFLILLGYGAGRMMDSVQLRWTRNTPFSTAGFIRAPVTRVQEIRPEAGNRVHIVVQEVRVREISGSRDDDGVRALLVGAARESVDPGVRMDSMEMLAGQSGLGIRNAIVNTIRNDPNAAVRVKAVESLRQFPSDSVIRGALEFALAHDRDPGVRAMAMDLLVPAEGDFQITPQLLQVMSNVMQSAQSDDYIRFRCAQILRGQTSSNDIH